MSRFKMVNGQRVQMTDAEVAARAQEEAAWEAGAPKRELERIERAAGMARWQREVVIATLPVDHPQRVKAEAAEEAIAQLGVRQ